MVRRAEAAISLAVISHTVVDASLNILPVILPLLVDRFHLSYSRSAWRRPLEYLLVRDAAGIRLGVRSVAHAVVHVGWHRLDGILMGCVGLVPNYVTLLLVIFLTGLGTAAFHPIASMAVALASGAQRGLGMSFFSRAETWDLRSARSWPPGWWHGSVWRAPRP